MAGPPNPPWPLEAVEARHVWHPFTQMREHDAAPPVPVASACGAMLALADGRRVFDGAASWWTCLHGHGHPRLVAALTHQAGALDHVMFAGFTHEPAARLVERLAPKMPEGLTRFFFSDNGSTAVEVALKMAFQAAVQRGERQRTKLGALRGAYHGDTLGAVGVGELENFMTALFEPLLLRCERLAVPADGARYVTAAAAAADEVAAAADIETFFARHGSSLAAFICEPLVQGAGGMHMWPPGLLHVLRACCTKHGVTLIFDEVMTGFGRTGTFLACESAGVTPDLLCLSKMLTGGLLPLALTVANDALYTAFLGEPGDGRAFLHGHSYTGNPIACAVAAESLALFDERDALGHVARLSASLRRAWTDLAPHPALREARTLGAIAAATFVDPATGLPFAAAERAGLVLHRAALDLGLLVRPIGATLYIVPPLMAPIDEVEAAVDALRRALDGTLVTLRR